MKVKNSDLYVLVQGHKLLKDLRGVEFIITVNTNVETAKAEVKVLDHIKKESERSAEFAQKQNKLYYDYSELLDDGSPNIEVSEQGGRQVTKYILDKTRKDEFVKKLNELKADYAKDIKLQESKLKDFMSALDKNTTKDYLELAKVDIPEDITYEQYQVISKFVKVK